MNPQTIDLNLASNPLGPLGGEVRARIVAAIERPSEETWDDAYTVILNRDSWMTIATLYFMLGGIVCLVIGLDLLLAYLVAGSPPY